MSTFNHAVDLDGFQELVQLIYGAALEPDLWHQLPEVLAIKTNVDFCAFWQHYYEGDKKAFMYAYNMDLTYLPGYRDYYCHMDMFNKMFFQQENDVVALSHHWLDYSELIKSEFYNDFMKPQDIYYLSSGRVEKMPCGNGFINISLGNTKSMGCITDEFASLLKALLPHLRKAININNKLAIADQYSLQLDQLYKRNNAGIMLVDNQSRPVFLNRVAEETVRNEDVISIKEGVLTIESSRLNEKLHKAIKEVSSAQPNSCDTVGSFTIKPTTSHHIITVVILPFSERAASMVNERLGDRARAMVLFFEDVPKVNLSSPLLSSLYDLTASEVRVVNDLVNGLSVKQIANKYGVSELTLRVQVKSIFRKTKVNRQTDLVSLMLLGPASATFT